MCPCGAEAANSRPAAALIAAAAPGVWWVRRRPSSAGLHRHSQRTGAVDGRIDEAQLRRHRHRRAALRQHIAFQINTRGYLDQREPAIHQIEHRTLGDVAHRPAETRHIGAVEAQVPDRGQELGARTFVLDHQPAALAVGIAAAMSYPALAGMRRGQDLEAAAVGAAQCLRLASWRAVVSGRRVRVLAAPREGRFEVLGEDVLVTGAGPIGIMAASVVRHAGARNIVITDLSTERLALAARYGVASGSGVGSTTLLMVIEPVATGMSALVYVQSIPAPPVAPITTVTE